MSNRYFVILEFLVSHLSVRNIESCALVRAYPNTCLEFVSSQTEFWSKPALLIEINVSICIA